MGCRQAVLDVLKAVKAPAADHALAAALAQVDGQTARLVIETLLARQTREGLKGLMACWHRLDEPHRALVLSRTDLIFSVLREAFASSDEQTRLNVIEMICRGGLCRASYLLDSGLHDRGPTIRKAAAGAIHALAETLIRAAPVWTPESAPETDLDDLRRHMAELERYQEDRRQLAAAVDAALGSFEVHQQAEVIEAAMWLADDLGARLWKALLTPGSRLMRVAQGLLGRERDARLIPFMLSAMGYAEFRPIVVQVLASCSDPSFLEDLLRESWRLAQPKTARMLAAIRDLSCTRNQLADVIGLPDDVQRHFSRYLLATGLADVMKTEVLKQMHRRGEPCGRRAALWGLTRVQDPHGTSMLKSISADGAPEHACIARRELARRRPAEYPVDTVVPGSDAPKSARSTAPKRMSAAAYWQAFDGLDEPQRIRLGKELWADGRLSPQTIAGWLTHSQPGSRMRALRIVGLLGLGGEFEEHLYRLGHDPDAEVRSASVALLGKVQTATSRRVLWNTLQDPDARVQANAVEALDQVGGESVAVALIPKLASPDNRTQANAVRALLKLGVREAAATLLQMLGDGNRAHRASALWLVEQMHLAPLAGRLLAMADSDSDERIRERARALAGAMASGEAGPEMAAATQGDEEVPS